mmetsp:Transcript_121352/g.387900  ORF Transcript_121352/g.387900 Transcript_121352/m.387900 type:complete len:877 (+) Transcript_121352:81-2711(+)
MPRARECSGPLSLAAATGPRAALLVFNIGDGAENDALRCELTGFVLQRELLRGESATGASKSVWLGDPRQGFAPWPAGGGDEGKRSGRGPAGESDRREGVAASASSEVAGDSVVRRGSKWALRHLIRDFKWGDYTVEPGSLYQYTLYAICGDSSQRTSAQGGSFCEGDDDLPTDGPGIHVRARVAVRVCTPPLYGGLHEVHFNRGVTGQRFSHLFLKPEEPPTQELIEREPEQWQWLSRGLEEALLHFLEFAKGPGWKIRAALYEAHYLPVARALGAAKKRGADVQLVIDWKIGAWSEKKKTWTQRGPQHMNMWALVDAGLMDAGCLHPRTKPLSAISHNKFFILVNPEDKVEAVWTGSTNITSGAIFGHSNVGHVVREPGLCAQYLKYWEKLKVDPEKAEFAQFNDELSPLPVADDADADSLAGLRSLDGVALFSPRLKWANALDFYAQLVLGATQSVAFTAAFGIGKEMGAALLSGASIPTYVLLEGEGNWASARETARALRKRPNVKVAVGTHLETAEGWLPETLTGLNQHVKYVHTKILLVDPLSDCPIVVSGSANFSRASMESNDENMLVVRGNKDLADAYIAEFFRMFEHMRFRNEVEGSQPCKCKCGELTVERVVVKQGPNTGRTFRACTKPKDQGGCGFFLWLDKDDQPQPKELPWPQRCFDDSSFQCLERQMLAGALPVPRATAKPAEGQALAEDGLFKKTTVEQITDALAALGFTDGGPASDQPPQGDTIGIAPSSQAASSGVPAAVSEAQPELVVAALIGERVREVSEEVRQAVQAVHDLLLVKSSSKGGSALWREGRDRMELALGALPEQPARMQVLELLGAINFKASSNATWKPQCIEMLRCLAEDPARIEEVSRRGRSVPRA